MRTVYLGTSEFAAVVLQRLADSPHRPALVVTRPDAKRGRGQKLAPPPVAVLVRELGIPVLQPPDLHAAEVLNSISEVEPEVLVVCAYGVLVKEPLLSYEILNVHPSLLPRWRGAAPVERAIMAGDAETGVAIMRLTAGLDSGPVCLVEREPIRADDDYGSLSLRLSAIGGEALVRALDERPPYVEQDGAGVTYAHKIEAADRALDPTRPPEAVERVVRALRPHIGARLPLPDGSYLGVVRAEVDGETLAPAGGHVRTDGERLLLDCNGGALELTEIQPSGSRAMRAADWLRGRRDPALTDFWLDPRLPARSLDELIETAVREWDSDAEWPPYLAALTWRGDEATLAAALELLERRDDPRARAVGAYVLGQLGIPERTHPQESAAALERHAEGEEDPEVLATIASALGNLGPRYGLETLLKLRRHADPRVREGAAEALAGRDEERVFDALVELTADPEPGIRDWATFALGTLSPQDTPTLRDALAARLDDSDDSTRIEAVHGLALRGDARALDATIDLLGEVGPHDDGGNAADTIWKRYALTQATVRLAALTGDARLKEHLPALDERLMGTAIEGDLRTAYDRVGDQ